MKTKRFSPVTPRAIDQFTSYIWNTPLVQYSDLVNKALEMGYDPRELIDASLGSVKYEKSGASLKSPLEDILNSVYEKDPTPGKRYIIDPSDITSNKAKEIAKNLEEGTVGYASAIPSKRRALADYAAVTSRSKDLDKLKGIADAGHELEHLKDFVTRPDFKLKTEKSYKLGHHFKDIYEPRELIREVKGLPEDIKLTKEIIKQSKKSGLKPSIFTRLRSLVGFLPSLAAAKLATYAPESKAAQIPLKVLEEGDPFSAIFPTEAGQEEEEEVGKMIREKQQEEENKIKQQNNLTDEQMRRWSKIKDQLKR